MWCAGSWDILEMVRCFVGHNFFLSNQHTCVYAGYKHLIIAHRLFFPSTSSPPLTPFYPSSKGAITLTGNLFGEGTGYVFMQNVGCLGNETQLLQCLASATGGHGCTHSQDVEVICRGRSLGGLGVHASCMLCLCIQYYSQESCISFQSIGTLITYRGTFLTNLTMVQRHT